MPAGKTRFQDQWLSKKDNNGHIIKDWCKKGSDDFTAFCFLCKKELACDVSGFDQLKQHAKGKKHIEMTKVALTPCQMRLSFQENKSTQNKSECKPALKLVDENVLSAETLWCLKVATSNYSFRSCDGIGDMFQAMFDCPTSSQFRMGRTKVSYLLSDGLGPYFTEELVSDVNNSKMPFTLHYDEATTAQGKKQLDLHIRYWSSFRNEVVVRFYRCLMFGHAKGKDVADAILKALAEDKVDMKLLIALSSDGPNVNKTIWRAVNSSLQESGHPGLVDIGTCYMHTVHNAFGKAKEKLPQDMDELSIDLFTYFSQSAARKEDFNSVQIDIGVVEHMFQRHVPSRWLTLAPVVDRILEQWEAIEKYMKNEEKKPNPSKSACYRRIALKLKSPETLVLLYFIQSVAPLFHSFLELFQSESPQIHILYEKLAELIRKLMLRYVKPELVGTKDGSDLCDIKHSDVKNQVDDDQVIIGKSTRDAMLKMPSGSRQKMMLGIRAFYSCAITYLIGHLPVSDSILKYVGCLNPLKAGSVDSIKRLAKKLPNVIDSAIVNILDEWNLYSAEMSMKSNLASVKDSRIDHYWREVLGQTGVDGKLKYPHLEKVVKSSLILSHGNADVERGFSVNNHFVTIERACLSPETISAVRATKDAVHFFDPNYRRPEKVPLTKRLLCAVKGAHRSYDQRLKAEKEREMEKQKVMKESREEQERLMQERNKKEKKKQELIKDNTTLSKEEDKVLAKEKEAKESLSVGEKLLDEGKERLAQAIKKKDFSAASMAQAMIDAGQKKCREASKSLNSTMESRESLAKSKRKLFETLTRDEGSSSKKKK